MQPDEDRKSWQYEVINGDTVLGFVDWLQHRAEANTDCERCGGTGSLARAQNPTEEAECPDCRGSGKKSTPATTSAQKFAGTMLAALATPDLNLLRTELRAKEDSIVQLEHTVTQLTAMLKLASDQRDALSTTLDKALRLIQFLDAQDVGELTINQVQGIESCPHCGDEPCALHGQNLERKR